MALTFGGLGVPLWGCEVSCQWEHMFCSLFTWLKACRSFVLLRALSCSQAARGLGVVMLTSWLLPLDRQNEIKLIIIWNDLIKE